MIQIVGFGVLTLVLIIPFYIQFQPAVKGFGFAKETIPLKVHLMMFGYFIITVLTPILMLIRKRNLSKNTIFLISLFAIGFIALAIPNFLFLKDIYFEANPPYYRANTVFKIWYQAFIIFSLITIPVLNEVLQKYKNKIIQSITTFIISFIVIYSGTYFYTSAKYNMSKEYKGLDGAKYLEISNPDYYKVQVWINKNIKGQPYILEAEGESYKQQSIISSFTGLPTAIGWRDHEFGWRNNWPEILDLEQDINTIYSSPDEELVNKLINKYQLKYIIVGPLEIEKHKFSETSYIDVLPIVWEDKNIKIFKTGN